MVGCNLLRNFFFLHRFKENNIIDRDLYNYSNTLEISDVTGLNGSFRCRVVSQFGSEFSEMAILKLLGRHIFDVLQFRKWLYGTWKIISFRSVIIWTTRPYHNVKIYRYKQLCHQTFNLWKHKPWKLYEKINCVD